MGRHGKWLACAVALAGTSLRSQSASAQPVPAASASASTAGTPGMGASTGMTYANPYTSPYLNPFLNPYMMQAPAQGNMALYFLAAQQANGGLGSGRLSGTRPVPTAAPSPSPSTGARRLMDVPGAGAAHYFNRPYQPAQTSGRYYNRQGRYYSSMPR